MTDSIRLTRRRLLGGLVTVGAAGAGAGAGAMAAFSDLEASDASTVQAGTLNLTLGGGTSATLLDETDIAPGDSGTERLELANDGSLDGYVDLDVASVTGAENGCANNESAADPDGCTSGEGELISTLETSAHFDHGTSTTQVWTDLTPEDLRAAGEFDVDELLGGQSKMDFVLEWSLPSSVGPEAQSDSVEFTLTFVLDQSPDGGI